MIDGIAGRSTSYEYDLAGRNVASTVTDTSEYDLVASGTTRYADGTGLVDKQTTTIYGANNTVAKHLTYLYGYGTPTSSAGPEAISGLAVNGEQYLYSYDTLGRLITRKTSIGAEDESLSIYQQTNTGKREEYTYVNNSDGTTTTLVKSFRDMLGVLHTYDMQKNGLY